MVEVTKQAAMVMDLNKCVGCHLLDRLQDPVDG